MNAIQSFVPSQIVRTFAAFLEFCYIARRNVITEDSLKQLDVALHQFHEARQVFSGTVCADDPSAFSLPRQHAMVHYHAHIENFGSPNGLCSSITESKHITAVKHPWRRSNKHKALPQMLRSNQRLDKLAAARADFTACGMLVDSCLLQAMKEVVMDCDDGDSTDEVEGDNDNDTGSDTSDEIWHFNTDPTSVQDLGAATPNFDNPDTRGLGINDTEAGSLNDSDERALNTDDDYPPSPHPPSTILFDEGDDDDDCGPVESGPLMNEVCLMSKKGQPLLPFEYFTGF